MAQLEALYGIYGVRGLVDSPELMARLVEGADITTMYISRGMGFEGGGMPRARFPCWPEIMSIELVGGE